MALEALESEESMKAYITASSGDDSYPTICGLHEFDSLEKAIDFARFGAHGLNPKFDDSLVLMFEP